MSGMPEETDDVALELDEMPIADSATSGIASASQLVDETNDARFDVHYY